MYEMGVGRELNGVVPLETDYIKVKDETVREIIDVIFDKVNPPTFKSVRGNFFLFTITML